jgi:hypothetical protein
MIPVLLAHVPQAKGVNMKQALPSNWLLAMLIGSADRTAERIAQKRADRETDPEISAVAKELERLAIGQAELFPLPTRRRIPFQLRFPGV